MRLHCLSQSLKLFGSLDGRSHLRKNSSRLKSEVARDGMSKSGSKEVSVVILYGDSDIVFWPKDLYPTLQFSNPDGTTVSPKIVPKGYPGATLEVIVSRWKHDHAELANSDTNGTERIVVVACAGENDVGAGVSLDISVSALERFLDQVFSLEESSTKVQGNHNVEVAALLILGPKFEPWQEDDPSTKKKYGKMARSFARCCDRHKYKDRIHFIDCLTMFCGQSSELPGASIAGRAQAQEEYFVSDGLHLSPSGYNILKEVVETHLRAF